MNIPLIPHDKANHFIYGLAIGFAVQVACVIIGYSAAAPLASFFLAAIAGGVKEGMDAWANRKAKKVGLPEPHGVESWDWVATTFGGMFLGISIQLARI